MFLIYKGRNRSLERRYLWYCFVIKFASFERPQDDERVFERLATGVDGSVWFAERFLPPRDAICAHGTWRDGVPFLNRFATDSNVRFWTFRPPRMVELTNELLINYRESSLLNKFALLAEVGEYYRELSVLSRWSVRREPVTRSEREVT